MKLRFPTSLLDFQRLFPDEEHCGAYLEETRWPEGFQCPHCGWQGDPFRFEGRLGVLRCRDCGRDISLTAGNEFTFRFNRRFYPFTAFNSLLGIGVRVEAPTYEELYSGEYQHPNPGGGDDADEIGMNYERFLGRPHG